MTRLIGPETAVDGGDQSDEVDGMPSLAEDTGSSLFGESFQGEMKPAVDLPGFDGDLGIRHGGSEGQVGARALARLLRATFRGKNPAGNVRAVRSYNTGWLIPHYKTEKSRLEWFDSWEREMARKVYDQTFGARKARRIRKGLASIRNFKKYDIHCLDSDGRPEQGKAGQKLNEEVEDLLSLLREVE